MAIMLSDEDLVKSTLGGDEHAFSQLYERYRLSIYATVYRIIQNSEEAKDATQEIFIKLYRSLSSWVPQKSRFSTWLYRLATNHAIDCWRLRHRRAESQLAGDSGEGVLQTHSHGGAMNSPYHEVEKNEAVAAIRRCVDYLPELQKKVFILRYFQDLKLEEIAEMESCSLGTVKTSLFRATRAIRQSLRRSKELV